jgi:drug/metabolite transporter (DMT)-like permease
MESKTIKGVSLAIGAAILWGVSGTVGQFLFEHRHINVEWLITTRMLLSGALLLSFSGLVEKTDLLSIWKQKKDAVQLGIFSLAGMLAVQYTYFAAINYSNAATATVLQYSGPILIAVYLAIKTRRMPTRAEVGAILLAIFGTVLLVTRGDMMSLSISGLALLFGLGSAVTLAIYTLQPARLLATYSSSLVIGWGMFFGGLVFSLVRAPWQVSGTWDTPTYLGVGFIVVFGTLVAFYAYMSAVKLIGGQKASLLASAEPLSAALIAVIWLGLSFTGPEWLGSFCIISTIFLLSWPSGSPGSHPG